VPALASVSVSLLDGMKIGAQAYLGEALGHPGIPVGKVGCLSSRKEDSGCEQSEPKLSRAWAA
jgi:hypothetical protein